MGWWLASDADGETGARDWVKRFDPRFWTVNFPRPMLAAVTTTAADALRVDCTFYRHDDLAGLIWESEDRFDHPLLKYETSRDYRGCVLSFRWRSEGGVNPLDAVYGPVLTIEGRDESGAARTWYVRLWNYAVGSGADAVVTLDFDALQSGFSLPGEAVWAGDIDRLFVSLSPPAYDGADTPLPARAEGRVFVEDIACTGPGSTLSIGDTMLPPHDLRIAGGYDDSYHLTPARLLRNAVHLGYRGWFNHYVGMSHHYEMAWDGARFVASGGLSAPARAWHADFAARCVDLNFALILSVSYELLDQNCPEGWKQRQFDGSPALTGWSPPSTLLSPANAAAMAWLKDVALAFAQIAVDAGQVVRVQIGEPWWWVGPDHKPCIHDAAAVAAYGGATPDIADVRDATTTAQGDYLDWLRAKLGASTLALRDAVKAAHPSAEVLLLFYAPQVLGSAAVRRLNLPEAWAHPAFDVLQLEDYDYVTGGDIAGSRRAADAVTADLGYPAADQHYFSGFVLDPAHRDQWRAVAASVGTARERGVAQGFVWALPQVLRDGFTWFENGDDMQPFHDVRFPLEVGLGASGGPEFSTTIVTSASGAEQRNSAWEQARMTYDAGLGVRSETDLATVAAFFRARRGAAIGFRFRDPQDFSSNGASGAPTPADQVLGVGDGAATRFVLVKRYGDGDESHVRRITRPDESSVRVAVGGIERTGGWALSDSGAIDFDAAPVGAVTAGFRFDVPVRFAEDRLEMSGAAFAAGEIPNVPLVEIREG